MFHPPLPGCTSVNMKVPMALSDEERGRLEKLEQEMAAADPELNRILQSGLRRNKATARIVYGVLAAFAGFALVIAGINKQLTVIGAICFLLMVAGAHLFLSGLGPQDRSGEPT
jgi:hypothetical protein